MDIADKTTGKTPLYQCTEDNSIEIVKILIEAGADKNIPDSYGITPVQLSSDKGYKDIFELFDSTERLRVQVPERGITGNEKATKRSIVPYWEAVLDLKLDRDLLTRFLDQPSIESLECALQTHNILLYAVRQGIFSLYELQNYKNDKDYLARNVYLPASKLITKYGDSEKNLFLRIVQHAEKVRFIADGRSFLVEIATQFHIELESNRKEFYSVIVKMNGKINDLDSRVAHLEGWSKKVIKEFNQLCSNNLKMVRNMQLMGNHLNELHAAFQKKKRRDMYASIIGIVLSLVPIIGPSLASAVNISEQAVEMSFDAGGVIAQKLLDVDMSSWENISLLGSNAFLSSLNESEEKRVKKVIEESKFGSPKAIQDTLAKYKYKTSEVDLGQSSKSEPDKEELQKRFEFIARNHTCTFGRATKELHFVLNSRFTRITVNMKDIEDKMEHYLDEMGCIDFNSFYDVYNHFASNKKKSVPREIEEMFQNALDEGTTIHKIAAKRLLKTLFDRSAPEGDDSYKLSFTRTKTFWSEDATYAKLQKQVDFETFRQEAVKMLFEDPDNYDIQEEKKQCIFF